MIFAICHNVLGFADPSSSASELVNMYEATLRKLRASAVTNLSRIPHDQQEAQNILSSIKTDGQSSRPFTFLFFFEVSVIFN